MQRKRCKGLGLDTANTSKNVNYRVLSAGSLYRDSAGKYAEPEVV